MEKTYQMGLAGFGMSGEVFHAPYIATDPRFALSVVYERTGSRAEELYPAVTTVRSFEALLESDVDVVVLCVPNALHVSMATAVLKAGKHVVVEKPLAPTAAEGEALFTLAEKQGRLLAVHHNRRYDGGFRAARELLENGTLGEVLEWESRFDRWAPELRPRKWKETVQAGSGVLYDLGSHLADEVIALFGPLKAVWGDLSTQREGEASTTTFLRGCSMRRPPRVAGITGRAFASPCGPPAWPRTRGSGPDWWCGGARGYSPSGAGRTRPRPAT